MAPRPVAKILGNWQDITFFDIFLHIRLQLSVKLHCVEPVLSRRWMSLVPYYFYVSTRKATQREATRWWERQNKEPFQNTCFGGRFGALTRHTPEAQAKSSNYRIQFSQNPVQLIVYIGELIQAPWFFWSTKNFTDCIDWNLCWCYLTLAIIQWFKLSDILHCKPVWCFRKKLKSNMHAGGGTNSNPVRSILVCFTCKHCNPIQSALKLLKGTICVTQWITFFDAKQCHWISFQAYYVSVSSKPDHSPPPPERPPGNRTFSLPGGRVFAQLSLPGGRGLESEKFFTVLKEKCRNFSSCFEETGGSLKSRCSRAVSYQFLWKNHSKCLLYL